VKLNDLPTTEQINSISNALFASRELIYLVQAYKKPFDPVVLNNLFNPVSRCVAVVTDLAARHSKSKTAPLLSALAVGAVALNWQSQSVPFQHVATHKANYVKLSKLSSSQEPVFNAFLSLLDSLQVFLETNLKTGLQWKGVRDPPPVLSWNSRGIVVPEQPSTKPVKGHQFIDGTKTPGDTTIDAGAQPVHLFGFGNNTVKITGKSPLILIEGSSFTTVEVQGRVESVRLENCLKLNVNLKENLSSLHIDRSDGCTFGLHSDKTEIITSGSANCEFVVQGEVATLPKFKFNVKRGKLTQLDV